MSNDIAPILNSLAGRFIAGVIDLAFYHPGVLCLILAVLAGTAFAVLLDVAAGREPEQLLERPIRLWRR